MFFNQRLSLPDSNELRDIYEKQREADGWFYLDFIIEVINSG